MNSVIDERIQRLAAVLPVLVQRLGAEDYVFTHRSEVMPGVDRQVQDKIGRIEAEIGAVPYAVAAFWRTIGSIDLCGYHPQWSGCEYPDPLVVCPVSEAIGDLDDFLAERDERLKGEFPYCIPISGDDYQKEDVSGGMWYNVDCPASADDPIVNEERHGLKFLDYLEMAVRWGGFPGLDRCASHNWPVERLVANLLPAR